MIKNWHQTIAANPYYTCAVKQTIINGFASREHLISNIM